jgi:hypothetical protein
MPDVVGLWVAMELPARPIDGVHAKLDAAWDAELADGG